MNDCKLKLNALARLVVAQNFMITDVLPDALVNKDTEMPQWVADALCQALDAFNIADIKYLDHSREYTELLMTVAEVGYSKAFARQTD